MESKIRVLFIDMNESLPQVVVVNVLDAVL